MTTAQLSAAVVAKGHVTVALTKPHDPAKFYWTRPGLYVCREYREHIVEKAKQTRSASPITLKRFVLEHYASDKNIQAVMGPNHGFTESEVCWIVAEMIGKQKNGEAGDLDNTGKVNLFYTSSWVVGVEWSTAWHAWFPNTWRCDDTGWGAGSSAFSRN